MAAGGKRALFSGVAGLVLAVMIPVLYASLGFIMGAIVGAMYNLFAKWVGGIEVNIQTTSPVPYPL